MKTKATKVETSKEIHGQDIKLESSPVGISSFLYATFTGKQPETQGLPSTSLNCLTAVALFGSYLLFFLFVRWTINSTDIVSSYILPPFIHCASLSVRYSAIAAGIQTSETGTTKYIVDARTLLLTMSLLYYVCVYVVSSVLSATAQIATSPFPYNNVEPRKHKRNMPPGLAHRTVSTHEALYDFFPAYSITAIFTAWCISPSEPISSPVLSALALHIFVKLAIWAPAYLLRAHALRGAAHIVANDALILAFCALIGREAY
ncbi:hypothetical protein SERLA73DRAFT_174469 [Serpula lacrymans var. lacrymans S7.3]|uniref:Uncharacterized protein n=2 Tax=Serpula lacrymans var. lacrymans TaxID=341189 RepID=F8PG18_SERL3|nr:uncharacterized protein SERLADRAFT_455999 [Serpula lacrymans var. lacrymans S7.9]EGO05353.1 hypothetical protein SERLA73DRAFT_174469 [Serpula lacrymans var. lacrymans S7.3]EGO31204.1 hypothetical protein SERLADRAFT_455999 [Serpula lacrymans var. lacrymans S7.9]